MKGSQDCISNLVVVQENNVKVSLSSKDDRTINTTVKRETYPISTLESLIDEMHGSKVFAKLDMRET